MFIKQMKSNLKTNPTWTPLSVLLVVWLVFFITSITIGFFWGFNTGFDEGNLASQESYNAWIKEHDQYRKVVEYIFNDLPPEEQEKYLTGHNGQTTN